jgi:hypothetical protein
MFCPVLQIVICDLEGKSSLWQKVKDERIEGRNVIVLSVMVFSLGVTGGTTRNTGAYWYSSLSPRGASYSGVVGVGGGGLCSTVGSHSYVTLCPEC